MPGKTPLSLYVHWPYCSFLCRFCAFSKSRIPSQGIDHARITSALVRELQTTLSPYKKTSALHSIYFGGGTPSLARPQDIHQIIDRANHLVPLIPGAEITLESNPTLAEVEKMRGFRAAGITRYSVGVQSLDDRTLSEMGRLHTGAEGLAAVDRAREVFPGNVTFDMIYGFPRQTPDQWQNELETALTHADQHISIYQLTVEPGTPLFRDQRARRIALPVDDTQARMHEIAVEACKDRGFRHYEVSSYAKHPAAQSRHNMGYWSGQSYVGIGPSAHSRFVDPRDKQVRRSVRVPDTRRWIELCESPAAHGTATIADVTMAEAKAEMVVFGLRMIDGLEDSAFRRLSANDANGQGLEDFLCMEKVHSYVEMRLLTWDPVVGVLKPTERGLQVIDSVLLDILPAME
ncbi:hypothetical protein LPJ66_004113 [Kickxella alabastrina]|uniref:Uncharacterized protein n=1 Tax=Kickxella alabastrina TaxID=61397 RepID=A0ACC1IIV5_9FUNG|nr:hypothetical protein LPJ66_004113 [Kickxella alabastrina]